MSDLSLNQRVIAEFRANGGRVGGSLEGALVVLVHHRGRLSGSEYAHPVVYLADADDHDTIHVFATNSGALPNPDWYRNLVASGDGAVELGSETYPVSVRELTGAERDRIYKEQARRNPVLEPATAGLPRHLQGPDR